MKKKRSQRGSAGYFSTSDWLWQGQSDVQRCQSGRASAGMAANSRAQRRETGGFESETTPSLTPTHCESSAGLPPTPLVTTSDHNAGCHTACWNKMAATWRSGFFWMGGVNASSFDIICPLELFYKNFYWENLFFDQFRNPAWVGNMKVRLWCWKGLVLAARYLVSNDHTTINLYLYIVRAVELRWDPGAFSNEEEFTTKKETKLKISQPGEARQEKR